MKKRKKFKRIAAVITAVTLAFSGNVWASSGMSKSNSVSAEDEKVFKVVMDESGYITPTEESEELMSQSSSDTDLVKKPFSWDNATVYFVLTDRFLNSDTSNDNSYGRGLKEDGVTSVDGLDYKTNPGTFHGGDLNGLTQKVEEGYFNDLGVNAIWITAPYEQIHGYTSANVKSNNANTYPDSDGQGFPYYSYHGYWTLDYTNIDENMGDEKDFENFVDSCHERGIRVVMDVVMNHVGYVTMQDAVDYGFDGVLTDSSSLGVTWKQYYYGNSTYLMGGDPESNNFWNKTSTLWASKWWGVGFVRASYPGYSAAGGDNYHMSLSGLPDVITESSASEVDTPPLLVTKWTKEGRLDKEQKELDEFFEETGYKKQPRYYIIKWLSDYVREYGVDGFRCDTAKHVDLDAWKDLKTECVKALKEWRTNNPDKAGADWTDDFWMTGEAWGHGMGKSEYFTSGGFDSMINFQFNKSGDPTGMESTYSSYAAEINSDPDFNVLSYITSHDDSDSTMGVWKSSAKQMKNQGTCLLLSPGGVQIYYGNEVNRGLGWTDFFTGSDYLDQRFRSDMDWSKISSDTETKEVLAHWQKVGQFRNNHIAVGAGQHECISTSPYTFKRTYHLEEEDEDKVVVCLPGTAGTYEVSVGDVFEDGETITDAYSGEKYEVSGGTVSVSCDDNGIILLEGSGIVKPSVSAKAAGNVTTYSADQLEITLKANKATDTCYSIDGGAAVKYSAGDVIKIGGDTAYEEKTTLVVTGKSEEDGKILKKEYTYQRSKEPTVSDGVFTVKVKKSDFANEVPKLYIYDNETDKNELAGAWPGVTLTEDPDDSEYYSYTDESITDEVLVILTLGATSNTAGTWRTTEEKATGMTVKGAVLYDKTSNSFSELPSGEPGKVTINYVDTSGKVLKSIYRVGVVGRKYTTYPATISGYTLKTTPDNATGVYSAQSEVTYVYSEGDSSGADTTDASKETTSGQEPSSQEDTTKPDETTSQEDTTKPDETTSQEDTTKPDETTSQKDTTKPDETTSQENTTKPDETTSQEDTTKPDETTSQKDTTPSEETTTEPPSEDPADVESDLKIKSFVVSRPSGAACVKQKIKFTVKTTGGTGDVKCRFVVKKNTTSVIRNYSKSKTAVWKPSSAGTYEIKVYVKDSSGALVNKSINKYKINKKITVKRFKADKKSGKLRVGDSVKLTIRAAYGTGKYKYKFVYKYSEKSRMHTIRGYSSKKNVTWTPSGAGTYTIYAYVKDAGNGAVVKKTMKYKVLK